MSEKPDMVRISVEEFRALIALRHHVRAYVDLDESRKLLPLAGALEEAEHEAERTP